MQSKDENPLAIIFGIAFIICAFGWYSSASSRSSTSSNSTSSLDDTSYTLEEAKERLIEYEDALTQANENITDGANCVDEAYGLFDDGSFDDGMATLDNCRYDTVSDPGTGI